MNGFEFLAIAAFLLLLLLYVIHVYNHALSLNQKRINRFNDLKAHFERRENIFKSILEQLGAGQEFERVLLENTTKIREGNLEEIEPLAEKIRKKLATAEDYPILKSIDLRRDYQGQIETIENAVLRSVAALNQDARWYNEYILSFPAIIFAWMFGHHEKKYFSTSGQLAGESLERA